MAVLPRRLRSLGLPLVIAATLLIGVGWAAALRRAEHVWSMPFFPHFNLIDLGLGPNLLPDRRLDNFPRAGPGFWPAVTRVGRPLSVKLTVFPETPLAPEVRVAERVVVPPYLPLAEAGASVVAAAFETSWKHVWTDERDGVAVGFELDRNASYRRYRSPLNSLRS